MKKISIYSLIFLILSSCNTNTNNNLDKLLIETNIRNFISIPISKPSNLFLNKREDTSYSQIALSQIYEGLFWENPATGKPEPLLVENYSLDASRTLYTFRLKKNIFFHDDACFKNGKGRQVLAQDILYCLNKIGQKDSLDAEEQKLIQEADSLLSLIDTNLNAKKDSLQTKASPKHKKSHTKITTAKSISNYQFCIRIANPNPNFLLELCQSIYYIYPKEMNSYYYNTKSPKLIGTGPFIIHQSSNKETVLFKNKQYHHQISDANTPKIDAIRFIFVNSKADVQKLFLNGEIDCKMVTKNGKRVLVLQSDVYNFTIEDLHKNNYKNIQIKHTPKTLPVEE